MIRIYAYLTSFTQLLQRSLYLFHHFCTLLCLAERPFAQPVLHRLAGDPSKEGLALLHLHLPKGKQD